MNGDTDDPARVGILLPRGGMIENALRRSPGSQNFECKLMSLMRTELRESINNIVKSLKQKELQSCFSDAFLIAARSGTAEEELPENEAILLRRASELIRGEAIVNSVSQTLEEALSGPVFEAAAEASLGIIHGPLHAAVSEALAELDFDPADPVFEQDEDYGFREYVKEIEALPTELIVDDLRPMIEDLKWKARTGCKRAVEELRDIGIQVSFWLEDGGRFSSTDDDGNGTDSDPDGGEANKGARSSAPIFDKARAAVVVQGVARESMWWPVAVPAIVDNRKASVEERVSKFSLGSDLSIRVTPRKNGRGSSRNLLPGSTKYFVLELYLELWREIRGSIGDDQRRELESLLKSDTKPPDIPQSLRSIGVRNPNPASWEAADQRSLLGWKKECSRWMEAQWKRRAILLPKLSKKTVKDWTVAMMALIEFKSDGDLDQFDWPAEIMKRSRGPVTDGQRNISAAAREIFMRELRDLAVK